MWSVWQVVLVGVGVGFVALIVRLLWVAMFRYRRAVSTVPSLEAYEPSQAVGGHSSESTVAHESAEAGWVRIDVERLVEQSDVPPGARWIDLHDSGGNPGGG